MLGLSLYGPQAASHRVRLSQFQPGLAAAGIDLQIQSLLDDAYLQRSFSGRRPSLQGLLAAYGRRLQALRQSDRFDLAIVYAELLPFLPGWLERRCLQESSAVVSLTQAAAAYLQQQYPIELAHQRIAVIPTCADLQRFQPAEPAPAAPLVIGCIGTVLSGWFLIDWLRTFFEAIARVDPTARFELISRDAPAAILASLHPAPSWADRLLIQSAAPAEMPAIVQRHTASVMFYVGGATSELGRSPTRMAEVLGCGRPVVANPGVGDVEQVVRQNRVGVLARGSSAAEMDACVAELLQLLQDSYLANRCRRTAEELYSLESGTAAYRQLYDEILN